MKTTGSTLSGLAKPHYPDDTNFRVLKAGPERGHLQLPCGRMRYTITDGIARFAENEGSGSHHGIDYVAGAFALSTTGVRVLSSESQALHK